MQVIIDAINFIKTLSLVDVVFFGAVIALIMLVITLIYFIKENNEEEDSSLQNGKELQISPMYTADTPEMATLKEITEALEMAEPTPVNQNHYEEEQEEKAIISYDELLSRTNEFAINYSEEENIDDELTIKKVDLDNLVNKDIITKPELNVSVLSYEKEEAFLEALKALQQSLN